MKAVLDAHRQKEVLEIDIQKDILRKEGEKKLSELENEIVKLREQNVADVDNYKKTKEAEANQRLYTSDYVRLEMAKNLATNTKFFFSGDQSPLGAVLAKIMGQE
jgi:acetyl-CoA carboxylase alpha subunit